MSNTSVSNKVSSKKIKNTGGFVKLAYWLFFFLILAFPFGQLTRLPIFTSEANIYLHDIVLMLIIVVWTAGKLVDKKDIKPIFFNKKAKTFFQFSLGFIAVTLFSLILAAPFYQGREVVIGFFYLFRWSSYLLLYFILKDVIKNKNQSKTKLLNLLIVSSITAAILGLLQYLFIPDITPLTAFGWDPHYFRVVGTYLDPGFTGMVYVLSLILITSVLLKDNKIDKKNSKKTFLLILGFTIIYLALSLTYSRSSFLAYIVAMFLITLKRKKIKLFLLIFLFGLITLRLLPRPGGEGVKLERQSTVFARLENWQRSAEIGFKKPLFGNGFNLYRYTQKNLGYLDDKWRETHAGAGADSSFLFVFATTGVVGLLAYLYLLTQILKTDSLVVKASFLSLGVHSFFNNSLFYSWLMLWGWLILALKDDRKQ